MHDNIAISFICVIFIVVGSCCPFVLALLGHTPLDSVNGLVVLDLEANIELKGCPMNRFTLKIDGKLDGKLACSIPASDSGSHIDTVFLDGPSRRWEPVVSRIFAANPSELCIAPLCPAKVFHDVGFLVGEGDQGWLIGFCGRELARRLD